MAVITGYYANLTRSQDVTLLTTTCCNFSTRMHACTHARRHAHMHTHTRTQHTHTHHIHTAVLLGYYRGLLMTQYMKENIFLLFDMHGMHALTVILVCHKCKNTLSISRYSTNTHCHQLSLSALHSMLQLQFQTMLSL